MWIIFKNEMGRTRKGLLIWGAVVGIVAFFGMLEYPFLSQYLDILEEALSALPKLGQLVFGVFHADLMSPVGYYVVMYYWTGLIVFTHAIYTGASIVLKESRDKTAEFLFTKPYKRSVIVWAKILAGLTNILIIGLVTIIMSFVAMLPITTEPSALWQILASGAGMLFTQALLMSLGFLCGAVFSTYGAAARGAAAVLLASYCIMFFIQYMEIETLNFLSPLTYFGVADVVAHGLSRVYTALCVLVIAVCLYLTQRLFSRKAFML